ncbi:MAG TPA: hypothetical protein VLA62_09625, partial [Solirubrobacterales bacterium]|nr:hypothetical protein [Solirubrobacterales bacterium]
VRFVDQRAVAATHWHQLVSFPLFWTGGQLLALAPALLLAALVLTPGGAPARPSGDDAFARRYVTALALGPFAVTTLIAALLGRLPITMWGYPLWGFAPLAAILWGARAIDPRRLRRFGRVFLVVLVGAPLAYAAVELLEPFVRDRPKATQFPGRQLAETITRQWRAKTGAPLTYVAGAEARTVPVYSPGSGEFAANNVAVYSPDRPRVIVHGNPGLSPWIDMADVERRGAVLIWQPSSGETGLPANLRATFPRAELQPPLVLPRQTLHPRRPVVVAYAFLWPTP